MGIMKKIDQFLFEGVRQAAANEIKMTVIAETYNMIDIALEDMGWDSLIGDRFGKVTKRTSESVDSQLQKNFREYNRDGRIKRGVNLHTDFTFGNGIQRPKAKNEIIQAIVDKIWDDPTNQRNMFSFFAQQKRHKEMYLSGELNLRFKIDVNTAHLKIYVVQPKNVKNIAVDFEDPERASFYAINHENKNLDLMTGEIKQSKDEIKVHRQFRYKLDNCTEEEYERGLIYHAGLNEMFGLLRGDSDVSAIRPAEQTAMDMAEDGATLSKANAEMGFKSKIKKGGKAMADKLVETLKTKTDGTNPSGSVGAEWFENENIERNWNEARNTGSQHREKDQRMVVLPVFSGFGFGEHYFGDASTGNLATSTAMELPVIKMTEAEQKIWESIYADIFYYAIDLHVAFGLLPGKVLDWDEFYVKSDVNASLDIYFPPIVKQDINVYSQAVALAVDRGLISEKSASKLIANGLGIDNIDEMIDELYGLDNGNGENEPTVPTGNPQEQPPKGNELKLEPMPEPKAESKKDNGNGNGNGKNKKYSGIKFL